MTDRCSIPGCRGEPALDYLGHGVCDGHWNEFMDASNPPGALKAALGIKENTMAKKKQIETPTTDATPEAAAPEVTPKRKRAAKAEAAETGAVEAKTEAPKKTRTKKADAPAQPEAAKPEPPPKEQLCVFACRIAEPERIAFHKATGPAGASRFARKLMVVFSNEDEAGFRELLKEARQLRG